MQPLKPIRPITPIARWWSDGLGEPAMSGAQDGVRYAFFPDKKLLIVESLGKPQKFATGAHRIGGVSQISRRQSMVFTTQHGPVKLDDLQKIP